VTAFRFPHWPARHGILHGTVAAVLLFTTNLSVAASEADEATLWRLWSRHMANPGDHETLSTAFRHFARTRPDDPLAPVANTIAAWHLLKNRHYDEAKELLIPYAHPSAQGTARGAHELARAWLTRLDREEVIEALDFYRTREVRYPDHLATLMEHPALPEALRPPLTDR